MRKSTTKSEWECATGIRHMSNLIVIISIKRKSCLTSEIFQDRYNLKKFIYLVTEE